MVAIGAVMAGALDIEQVDAILRVMNKIPTCASGDTADLAEMRRKRRSRR